MAEALAVGVSPACSCAMAATCAVSAGAAPPWPPAHPAAYRMVLSIRTSRRMLVSMVRVCDTDDHRVFPRAGWRAAAGLGPESPANGSRRCRSRVAAVAFVAAVGAHDLAVVVIHHRAAHLADVLLRDFAQLEDRRRRGRGWRRGLGPGSRRGLRHRRGWIGGRLGR